LEVAPYLPRRDHRFEALLHHRKPVGAPRPDRAEVPPGLICIKVFRLFEGYGIQSDGESDGKSTV
jgi:hypothetical protein